MTRRLKEATETLHKEVEAENLARFIMDHSIERSTYELLLLQNYIAYKITESAISSFIEHYSATKHVLLEKDLEALHIEKPDLELDFSCNSRAEAYGAAYVVEGSALGGLVLAKNLEKCPGLSQVDTHHFFNGNKDNLRNWNSFKEELESQEFSEKEMQEAIDKAKETFQFFQHVFRFSRENFYKATY